MRISVNWTTDEGLPPLIQQAAAKDDDSGSRAYHICIKVHPDEVVFLAACIATLIVLHLPMTYVSGKPVPILVFGNAPPAFHAFLLCLLGASCACGCSIHIRMTNPPNSKTGIARLYYVFAVLCLFAGFAIALCCAAWEMFKAKGVTTP